MKRVLVLLITSALLASMVGCTDDPEPTPPVEYSLTISSSDGGEVTTPGEGVHVYSRGEVVSLVAASASGHYFGGWTGDVSTVANTRAASTTITMNGDYSITANFQVIPIAKYNLTVSSTEGGSVTAPGEGTFTYDAGTVVEVVAEAEEGYQFTYWTGSVGSIGDVNAASTSVTMTGDYTITASFAKEIQTWYDLDAIRDNLSGHYVLMNELDSTTAGYAELAGPTANGGKGWEPIGRLVAGPNPAFFVNPVEPFTGSLAGQSYEIRDLSITRPEDDGVGLFGCVDGPGVVDSLGLANVAVCGRAHVGGMAGWNGGSLTHSHSGGTVTGDQFVGGLVGGNWHNVGSSHSTGVVAGTSVVGGLVGNNRGNVSESYSSCGVDGFQRAGGLAGWNYGGTVTDSYSTGSVVGHLEMGGMVGWNWGLVVNSHYDHDKVLINGGNRVTVGALSGEDFEDWLANGKFLDVNERLSEEAGYHVISSVADFRQLLAFGQDSSLRFRLTTDLDLQDEPGFFIPYFAGEFDGHSHRVLNLRLDLASLSQVGLFGCLASGAKVTSLGIENAVVTGSSHVGTLVGIIHDGTVSNCDSNGSVSGKYGVGGLAGFLHVGTVSDSSFVSGGVSCSSSVGGLVGENHYGTVSNSHYDHEKVLINGERTITTGALYTDDFAQWIANDKFLDVDERLSKEGSYYVIGDVNDFRQLLAFGQNSSLRFRLTGDIDLSAHRNFYVPYLAGEFDGNGHRFLNLSLSCDSSLAVGLFGWLAPSGKINDVAVENAHVTGPNSVGVLVGRNWRGTVNNSSASGTSSGDARVAGLVGWNDGAIGRSCSGGTVIGRLWVGGLAGVSGGTIMDSCSSGSVTGDEQIGGLVGLAWGSLSNCYSTSSVTGERHTGGLVGVSTGAIVSNSFWDIQTSGQATSDGGTGKTTAEMKGISIYRNAGWQIVAVAPGENNTSRTWNIVDGQTYPFLSWQQVP